MENKKTRDEEALNLFAKGFNCSQSVSSVFAEKLNIDKETIIKAAGGFGGGIGSSGNMCGAVTGGIIAIGLKYSSVNSEDTEAKKHVRELAKDFMKSFAGQFGSVDCKQILGYDFSKPEEFEYVHNNNVTRQVCPKFIKFAVQELDKIL